MRKYLVNIGKYVEVYADSSSDAVRKAQGSIHDSTDSAVEVTIEKPVAVIHGDVESKKTNLKAKKNAKLSRR